jgi:hypothetical protein
MERGYWRNRLRRSAYCHDQRGPATISEPLDLDGDGQPDCVVSFQVPRNPRATLHVDVKPLNALVKPMNGVSKDSFSSLIARVNDTIVVRVPLR